jgi:hypothetical protein
MFDLAALQAKLPSGALTDASGDVTISLSALTGQGTVALTDTIAADAVHDLLQGCADTQVDYNSANPDSQISSFPQPAAGTAIRRDDGTYRVQFTFNVQTWSSVDLSSTTFAQL